MPELCERCRNRRAPDRLSVPLAMAVSSASAQAELTRQRDELETEQRLEDLAFQRAGGGRLSRRPTKYDWCAAQSQPRDGNYYFCDWLTEPECAFFQCSEAIAGCGRCETGLGRCERDTRETDALPSPPAAATAEAPTPAVTEWALPLGAAFDLHPVSRTMDDSLGPGSFQVDYELRDSSLSPQIRGAGLAQTYLIFGGPGSGKTYYFKYLMSSLLDHPSRPGCLLLDPKGVLTPWVQGVLDDIGRRDDLTVLGAGRSENSFNVLGDDLPANELGRLLSEVVLAGAAGIDEGWQVLISDLLESAAVVISALDGHLTAKALLRAILYRRDFTYPDGRKIKEYPIVIRATRAARQAKSLRDADLGIAADRVEEYFASTEPRQRRFVRQIIERSLGELMSPEWAYLSSADTGESVYSGIIGRHQVVTVAVGQSSPAFQRSMSTLVKSVFQQAVLADLSKRPAGRPAPFFILACDEYAQAITEGETGLVSDSRFFSLSREAGCMSILALQSVATGRSRFPAAMRDRWDGILGNVTVKLFMRCNDVETAEMGSTLAGSQHSFIPVLSQQRSAQGLSATEAVTMLEHRRVPPWYLTNRMARGYALVHGTLDGESVPTSLFVRAPWKP